MARAVTAWERDIVPSTGSALVNEIAAHSSGDAIATGNYAGQLLVMRLDGASGADAWPALLASGTSGTGSGDDLALDPVGNAVVSGTFQNTATSSDFAVLKVDADTGEQLWRRDLDQAGSPSDGAQDVAIDAVGNVVAAGMLDTDFAIVKLRGSDGQDFPVCGDVDQDEDIDTNDYVALRNALTGIPPGLPAPGRCSVIGGPNDCDLADAVVMRRSQFGFGPGVASVCADAVE